jgi:hypothetical protein
MESKEVAKVTQQAVAKQGPTLFELSPEQRVAKAAEMAGPLADVIEKQGLFSNIGGKKHVHVEGWSTLGAMLGFLPREVAVRELPDGSYEAKVELYSIKDNVVVGGASAICGMDEKRWKTAEKYARRSMAITRATGKAYRLGFSWIMTLAGYEPTPFEEMPDTTQVRPTQTRSEPVRTVDIPPSRTVTTTTHNASSASPGEYEIQIGYLKGKKIRDIPGTELTKSINYWRKKGNLTGDALAFVSNAEDFLNQDVTSADEFPPLENENDSDPLPF